jgi:excisionase family DNA binding protein
MAEQKILLIVDAKDIEQIKTGIDTLNEMVQQLLSDRLENSDTYLTSEEASKLLKITKHTLYQWRNAGILKCSRIGRRVYFKNKDVQDLIERNTLR